MLEYKSLQRANFWKVLSSLLNNGISLQRAFIIAIKWADKDLYRFESKIILSLEQNKNILSIMNDYDIFTNLEKELVSCGLKLGKLGAKIESLADLLSSVGLPPINEEKSLDFNIKIKTDTNEEQNTIDSGFNDFFNREDLKESGFVEFHDNNNNKDNSPINKFVNYIIFRAISDRVTGITIEACEADLKIIYFKGNKVVTPKAYQHLPLKLYDEVVSYFKQLAGIDSEQGQVKKSGDIDIEDENFKVTLSLESELTDTGEILNITLLYDM